MFYPTFICKIGGKIGELTPENNLRQKFSGFRACTTLSNLHHYTLWSTFATVSPLITAFPTAATRLTVFTDEPYLGPGPSLSLLTIFVNSLHKSRGFH